MRASSNMINLLAGHAELVSASHNPIRKRISGHATPFSNLYKALSCLAVILCLAFTSKAQNLADSAQKAYEKQQYKTAIVHYERILASGQSSANLYFNIGNAYYKDNQLGKAIYYYELARKLSPGDEDIKTNLKIANSKTIDKIDAKENFLAGAIKSGIYSMFSTSGWAWLSILAVVFT